MKNLRSRDDRLLPEDDHPLPEEHIEEFILREGLPHQ